MRILVCDDQPDVVEALRLLLKSAGYRIDTADRPGALISLLEQQSYDLILMDMNYSRDTTSGEEGLELVAAISHRARKVPVIVMTAWGSVDLAVEAMQRGASDFIQKPWDNNKVLALVAKHIARSAAKAHSELEIARSVQQGLFPGTGGRASGVEYEGLCVPAREIGGDYYDFLPFPDGRIGFVLADVSGKGVPAALLMANLQGLFRSQSPSDPRTMLRQVNSLFFKSTPPAHYATAFFAIYDPQRGVIDYANCGHPSALLATSSGGNLLKLETTATVLGIMEDFEVDVERVAFSPGDCLLVFTDGVSEAGVDSGDEFGEARVEEALGRLRDLPVAQIVPAIARAAEEYSRGEHGDDMTLLGVRALQS